MRAFCNTRSDFNIKNTVYTRNFLTSVELGNNKNAVFKKKATTAEHYTLEKIQYCLITIRFKITVSS